MFSVALVFTGLILLAWLVVAVLATAIPWEGFWPKGGQPLATVLGGLAVLAGGTLAFYNGRRTREHDRAIANEEHSHETEKELNARFTTAAAQLGDTSPAVRRAGAYALAALADDWDRNGNPHQKQVCIDVLCSYLVTPAHVPNSKQTHPEWEVKRTVQRIIANHLQLDSQTTSWSGCKFNFENAYFQDLDFSECRFDSVVTFRKATFEGEAVHFEKAVFAGESTSFNEALFKIEDSTYFRSTQFLSSGTSFWGAQFTGGGSVDFYDAKFVGKWVSFEEVHFEADDGAYFTTAEFEETETTSFVSSTFNAGNLSFISAKFKSPYTYFQNAQFNLTQCASFKGAEYIGVVDFSDPKMEWNKDIMEFDWDAAPGKKPGKVRPKKWPPTRSTVKTNGAAAAPSPPAT